MIWNPVKGSDLTFSPLSSLMTFSQETATLKVLRKSFAQAVVVDCDSQVTQLPPPVVLGDIVQIRIAQEVYEAEFKGCNTHLHGRVTLKGMMLHFPPRL